MGFQELLIVNLFVSAAEAYVLLRTTFSDHTFQQVFSWSFGINFSVQLAWALFIWPFFFNPLRHLPAAKVGYLLCLRDLLFPVL
jgi:hypothetical protein